MSELSSNIGCCRFALHRLHMWIQLIRLFPDRLRWWHKKRKNDFERRLSELVQAMKHLEKVNPKLKKASGLILSLWLDNKPFVSPWPGINLWVGMAWNELGLVFSLWVGMVIRRLPHSLQRCMDEIRRRSSKIILMRLSHEGDRIDGVGERGLKKKSGGSDLDIEDPPILEIELQNTRDREIGWSQS